MTSAMSKDIENVLSHLSELQQKRELSIIKLSEPILSQAEHQRTHGGNRSSDVSSAVDASEATTSASLEADLAHYKELFTKLRFSYIEQTTKEKFLRAVVGDPPIYVSASENAELESHLVSVKASLKSEKTDVAELVTELQRESRQLSRRHQDLLLQTEQLYALPADIDNLKITIDRLRQAQARTSDNPAMNLPLPQTLELLEERKLEAARLDEQLAAIALEREQKNRELGTLREEVQPLEKQKASATAAAGDARRRKDEGVSGTCDDLENKGRWLRGVEATLRGLLEVKG